MTMKPICFLAIAIVLFSATFSGAGMPAAMMQRTEDKILREIPTTSREVLVAERPIVEKAFRGVQPRLKEKGFSDKEIVDIFAAAWFTKKKSSSVKLSEAMILEEVRKHGLLVVDSTPGEAEVTIDRKKEQNTECRKYVLSGTYHITIRKEGYVPEEADQFVPSETKVVFKKVLRPLSSNSPAAKAH